MTLPDPELARDLNRKGVDFLFADLETGLAFCEIAASADRDKKTRQRNRGNARKAYDTVLKLSEKLALTSQEKIVFDEKVAALKRALQTLGEVL